MGLQKLKIKNLNDPTLRTSLAILRQYGMIKEEERQGTKGKVKVWRKLIDYPVRPQRMAPEEERT